MADLFVISNGTGKVYRYDGSTWSQYANAPITWPSPNTNNPQALLFAYRGKILALVGRTSVLMDLYRLDAGGTWTALATGIDRVAYARFSGAARYRGKIYVPLVTASQQIKLMEWDGSSAVINDVTGMWDDCDDYSTANVNTPHGGCIKAWRERLLLGQYAQSHNDSMLEWVEYPNFLYALDPVAGAGVSYQKFLGGPDGSHLTSVRYPNRSGYPVSVYDAIQRTHLGYGLYQGKIYVLGVDGGVREYTPAGVVTPTPIFSFRSAFPVLGPFTAHASANPDPEGLRVALSSGGRLQYRELIVGMEVTCDGRVGVCVGQNAGADPVTLYLRDDSDVPMGNFPAGASYTVKQGLGYVYGLTNDFYYGNIAAAFFGEYAGVMYVLICGTQRVQLSPGIRCPSILARWDGVTASFTGILYSSATLNAAGANVQIDQSTGRMHVIHYASLTDTTVEWRHVEIDLTANPPAVLSSTAFASETWTTYVSRWGMGYEQSVAFNLDRPTAEVTNLAYDPTTNKMTVTYILYDDSSNNCNITVETDYGTGWFEATRKGVEGEGKTNLTASPSGETHTFVHDIGADGSPQVNRIQYKITASQVG